MKEPLYRKRPCDRETESLRIWKTDKDSKEAKEMKDLEGFKVKYKGMELKCMGFSEIRNKKGKLVFAIKFKHEDKLLLYYIPDKISKKDKEKMDIALEGIQELNKVFGYEIKDMKEVLKNIYNEQNTIEKL